MSCSPQWSTTPIRSTHDISIISLYWATFSTETTRTGAPARGRSNVFIRYLKELSGIPLHSDTYMDGHVRRQRVSDDNYRRPIRHCGVHKTLEIDGSCDERATRTRFTVADFRVLFVFYLLRRSGDGDGGGGGVREVMLSSAIHYGG